MQVSGPDVPHHPSPQQSWGAPGRDPSPRSRGAPGGDPSPRSRGAVWSRVGLQFRASPRHWAPVLTEPLNLRMWGFSQGFPDAQLTAVPRPR